MSDTTYVLEAQIAATRERLTHEKRMRKNADNIINIQNTRIKKMSKKIAHLEAEIESITGKPREYTKEEATQ